MNWFIIECTAGKELAAKARLMRLGASEVWYPTKQVNDLSGAKRRTLTKLGKPVPRKIKEVAAVTGYVFAQFDEIDIDRIRNTPGKLWLRVFHVSGKPYVLTDADLASMAQMPDRIRDMIEALKPREGDKVRVIDGLFQHQVGIIEQRKGDDWIVDFGGKPITLAEQFLEKVA